MTGGRDGYILVAVLGTMLVLAGLIASGTLVAQAALRSARADDGAARLDGLLRGGLELAAFELFTRKEPFAAVNGRPLRLLGGLAVPTFADEAGKIDINASDPAILAGAFRAAGIEAGLAANLLERLAAMRGTDSRSGAPPIAPDASDHAPAPQAARGGTQAPHTDFPSVADFVTFAGLDREVADALARMLTVYNPDGRVDVLTASSEVLAALPGVSDAQVDSILADRRNGPSAVAGLRSSLGAPAAFVKFEPGPCYGIDVTATDAIGRAARRHGVVAASRSPDEPFYLLAWEQAP